VIYIIESLDTVIRCN